MGRTELASEVAGGSVDGKLPHEEEAFVEAGDESVGRMGISVERGMGARRFRAEESGDGAVEVGAVKIFGVDDKILDEDGHSVVHEQSRGEEGDGEGEGLKPEPSGGGADNGPMDTRPDSLVASAGGVEEIHRQTSERQTSEMTNIGTTNVGKFKPQNDKHRNDKRRKI